MAIISIIFGIIGVYPLIFVFLSAFKTDTAIFLTPFGLPKSFSLDNFVRAWQSARAGQYLLNSMIITSVGVVITALVAASASYVLTRLRLRFIPAVFFLFASGMFIPIHATMIPIAVNIARLGLKDNVPALILTMAAFQVPISIFIISAQMKGIPSEIEESAVTEGVGNLQIFWSLILPMSLPGISTASIFNFLGFYNNLIFPLLFISKKDLMPISYGLLAFFGERQSDFSGVMAAIIIAVIIPITAYIILQDRLEESMTAGALKG